MESDTVLEKFHNLVMKSLLYNYVTIINEKSLNLLRYVMTELCRLNTKSRARARAYNICKTRKILNFIFIL